MDQNADNAADELQRHAPPEVSVNCQSLTELMVQALVADQSGLSTPQYRDRVLKKSGGDSHMEGTGMLVGNFEFKP